MPSHLLNFIAKVFPNDMTVVNTTIYILVLILIGLLPDHVLLETFICSAAQCFH